MPAQPDRALQETTETMGVKRSAQCLAQSKTQSMLAIMITDHHGNPINLFFQMGLQVVKRLASGHKQLSVIYLFIYFR